MDPSIANLNLSPPRQGIVARGLLPALLLHAVVAAAFAVSLVADPLGQGMPAPPAAKAQAPAGVGAPAAGARDATAVMGAPPAQPAPPATPRTASVEAGPPARTRPAVAGPSFDCAMARSTTERLICGDPDLARQDRELGRLYARAKAAAPDAAAFWRENNVEWKAREATCRDRDCLVAWYAQRRAQLTAALDESPAAAR
jgi:hypothetical protein